MAPAIPTAMERPHFIGIGGAGMSGIAKILAQRGAKVAGSDAKESGTAEALRALGATVHIGHAAEHLASDASSVVVSSAIRADNPELVRAAELAIPVVHRSDALAALMGGLRAIAVAGTHGKTTTTSMLAVALTELGLDPSYAIGGDLAGPGTNARHGEGDIFVAEADESDRSFQKYDPRSPSSSTSNSTTTPTMPRWTRSTTPSRPSSARSSPAAPSSSPPTRRAPSSSPAGCATSRR